MFSKNHEKSGEYVDEKELEDGCFKRTSSINHDTNGLSNLSTGKIVAVVTSVVYALSNIFIKMATSIVDPKEISLITGIALLIGSGCLFLTNSTNKISRWYITVCVLCGSILFLVITLGNIAFEKSRAGDVVAVQYSSEVLMSGVIAYLFLGESFGFYFILLSVISIAGVFLVIQPPFLFLFEDMRIETDSQITGMILAVTSGGGFSVLYTLARHLLCNKCPFHILVFLSSVTLFVGSLCLMTSIQKWTTPQTPQAWLIVLCAGSLDAFALITCLWSLEKDPVLFVSLILTFELVVTYVLEYFICSTIPTTETAVGALLIFISCLGIIVYEQEDGKRSNELYWVPPFELKYQLIVVSSNK